jgi:hypothetical protein
MKAIHYDAEGDILSVTFTESSDQMHTGVELADNIVLYFNPDTGKPLQLVLLSYQAMVRASEQTPILLDGLARTPAQMRATIVTLLQRAPLTAFLQVVDTRGKTTPTGRLFEIFTPAALQTVAVS